MFNIKSEIKYLIILIVIPITILFLSALLSKNNNIETLALSTTNKKNIKKQDIIQEKKLFINDIKIEAKSALVKDLNTGEVIFSKNANEILPLASLTKVLTALTAETLSSSNLYKISYDDLKQDGDNLLSVGEVFKKNDLLNFMLISSSNDAATSLASNQFLDENLSINSINKFVDQMNDIAKEIGMSNSHFLNPTGLDKNNNVAGAHGTATDVATLFEYTLKNYPHILENTKKSNLKIISENGIVHKVSNTNQEVGNLPNVLASKTGFTDLAGGNLAVIIDPALNRPIIIVVLGSTGSGRFSDVKLLSDKVIEYLKK